MSSSPGLPQALRQRGYVLGGWPWRAALYLLTSVPLGIATLTALLLLAVAGGALSVVLIGIPLLLTLVLAGIPLAALERRRLRLLDPRPLPPAHREPDGTGLSSWLRTRLQERSTWRELGYALLFALVLWPLEALAVGTALTVCGGLIAAPAVLAASGGEEVRVLKIWLAHSYPPAFAALLAGVVLLPVFAYPLGLLAAGRAVLTRQLLAPPDAGLDSRLRELGRSRMRLVDAFEAERRRIERDLHDGAQQRLVALSMTLGLARLENPAQPLAGLLAKAHDEAGDALVEIRELIQGIHPRVLTDRGLRAAVEDVADRSVVPVDVDLDLPDRLPEAVETGVYFAVCEALANVAKHSGAGRALVTGRTERGRLVVEVSDDGVGGAVTSGGTGLEGVADRLSVLGGHLLVSSPPGGPTVFRLEVPAPSTPSPRRT
ncbi:sensor domain-containing protein [Streptomyces sp. NBC_00341]|uniref:sensor histidine kinase n=1 Tax=unclassified Streptomyces TaxID=2593676 RepID=UPI002E2D3E7C|nr:sensor domain-containing protein [Streptomyces sp. NBC_00304]WRZ12490.1 sensor domain-containing protein [Streptomyces sp. NBC_00341]